MLHSAPRKNSNLFEAIISWKKLKIDTELRNTENKNVNKFKNVTDFNLLY